MLVLTKNVVEPVRWLHFKLNRLEEYFNEEVQATSQVHAFGQTIAHSLGDEPLTCRLLSLPLPRYPKSKHTVSIIPI